MSDWTEEITNDLIELDGTGLQSSMIAKLLNKDHGTTFTRAAVGSKIDRLRAAKTIQRKNRNTLGKAARPSMGLRKF